MCVSACQLPANECLPELTAYLMYQLTKLFDYKSHWHIKATVERNRRGSRVSWEGWLLNEHFMHLLLHHAETLCPYFVFIMPISFTHSPIWHMYALFMVCFIHTAYLLWVVVVRIKDMWVTLVAFNMHDYICPTKPSLLICGKSIGRITWHFLLEFYKD